MRHPEVVDLTSSRFKYRYPLELRYRVYKAKGALQERLTTQEVAHLLRCTPTAVNHEEVTGLLKIILAMRNDSQAVEQAEEVIAACEKAKRTAQPLWADHFNPEAWN